MSNRNTILENDDDLRRRVERRVNKRSEFRMHATAFGITIGALWLIYLAVPALAGWWWILVATTLGWGSGLAGHAVDTYFQVGAPAERIDEAVWREMRDRFGSDWRTAATRMDYDETRHRLSRRTEKLKDLLIHGSVYVMINLMLWILWAGGVVPFVQNILQGDISGFSLPMIVMVLWGIGMGFHVADVLTTFNRGREVESAVERERDRMARLESKAKRKNDERRTSMHIGDDGELVELIDDEPVIDRKAKRGES